ncbi:hypothetical protein [Paenibacillus sp. GP183]|uniref:hypothetical protein n=1 Tax=Paenibacillus sp. GP183 TaxID=1882751 RepID=UPI00089BB01D|nr:hypothetical protein [Paenibacillus sp. GP183]SEB60973.1 hypothetical protein SAMN05443246_1297 [Paenibacillus sp. GP183]
MILYPPVRFDLNEWFVIAATVLGWSIYLLIRNRFSLIVVIGLWLFNFYLGQTVDFAIALSPPIDLYDINDLPQYEWFDLFLYCFTYLPVSLLVVRVYVWLRPRGWRLAAYLLAVALVTTGLEAVAWMCHVYHYKGWSLYYSFLFYLVSNAMNVTFYRLIIRLLPQERHHEMP